MKISIMDLVLRDAMFYMLLQSPFVLYSVGFLTVAVFLISILHIIRKWSET